jgi:hypothetical protein
MRAPSLVVGLCLALFIGAGPLALSQEHHAEKSRGEGEPHWNSSSREHAPAARPGDWLRRYANLPPAEQQKALEKDPGFRSLPPERQARLRQRLQEFASRPPAQREQMLNRMATFSRLNPEQRERARDVFQQFRNLPPDRRQMVRDAYRNLTALSPEQRRQVLDSPALRSNFTDQEREMLRGMTDLNLGPNSDPAVPRPPVSQPSPRVPRPPY